MVWSSCARALGITIAAGLVWRLLIASQLPLAALRSIGVLSAVVFHVMNAIKHELACIACQLGGHWSEGLQRSIRKSHTVRVARCYCFASNRIARPYRDVARSFFLV
jgi:hypothetical protein